MYMYNIEFYDNPLTAHPPPNVYKHILLSNKAAKNVKK